MQSSAVDNLGLPECRSRASCLIRCPRPRGLFCYSSRPNAALFTIFKPIGTAAVGVPCGTSNIKRTELCFYKIQGYSRLSDRRVDLPRLIGLDLAVGSVAGLAR